MRLVRKTITEKIEVAKLAINSLIDGILLGEEILELLGFCCSTTVRVSRTSLLPLSIFICAPVRQIYM